VSEILVVIASKVLAVIESVYEAISLKINCATLIGINFAISYYTNLIVYLI